NGPASNQIWVVLPRTPVSYRYRRNVIVSGGFWPLSGRPSDRTTRYQPLRRRLRGLRASVDPESRHNVVVFVRDQTDVHAAVRIDTAVHGGSGMAPARRRTAPAARARSETRHGERHGV